MFDIFDISHGARHNGSIFTLILVTVAYTNVNQFDGQVQSLDEGGIQFAHIFSLVLDAFD